MYDLQSFKKEYDQLLNELSSPQCDVRRRAEIQKRMAKLSEIIACGEELEQLRTHGLDVCLF